MVRSVLKPSVSCVSTTMKTVENLDSRVYCGICFPHINEDFIRRLDFIHKFTEEIYDSLSSPKFINLEEESRIERGETRDEGLDDVVIVALVVLNISGSIGLGFSDLLDLRVRISSEK